MNASLNIIAVAAQRGDTTCHVTSAALEAFSTRLCRAPGELCAGIDEYAHTDVSTS